MPRRVSASLCSVQIHGVGTPMYPQTTFGVDCTVFLCQTLTSIERIESHKQEESTRRGVFSTSHSTQLLRVHHVVTKGLPQRTVDHHQKALLSKARHSGVWV